jgi:hypothetical protein
VQFPFILCKKAKEKADRVCVLSLGDNNETDLIKKDDTEYFGFSRFVYIAAYFGLRNKTCKSRIYGTGKPGYGV